MGQGKTETKDRAEKGTTEGMFRQNEDGDSLSHLTGAH